MIVIYILLFYEYVASILRNQTRKCFSFGERQNKTFSYTKEKVFNKCVFIYNSFKFITLNHYFWHNLLTFENSLFCSNSTKSNGMKRKPPKVHRLAHVLGISTYLYVNIVREKLIYSWFHYLLRNVSINLLKWSLKYIT